jgi:hypothetical protein
MLIAHARKKGKTHRGGGRNYDAMKNDIARLLKQDANPDLFFTTMVDLYALHSGFPGRKQAERLRGDPLKRVQFLEKSWADDIADRRFIPHIQLHEYEAILFADVSQFDSFYDNAERSIEKLKKIAESVTSPELIDDGQQTAPSKRIIEQFPDYKDAKTTVGPQAASRIGLTRIRSKCPHFDAWVTRLESLGSTSQEPTARASVG